MGRRPGLVALAAALAGAALLIAAPSALAHAQLLGTSPASGTVATQPAEVTFKSPGRGDVRVLDVSLLDVSHPEGHGHWMVSA